MKQCVPWKVCLKCFIQYSREVEGSWCAFCPLRVYASLACVSGWYAFKGRYSFLPRCIRERRCIYCIYFINSVPHLSIIFFVVFFFLILTCFNFIIYKLICYSFVLNAFYLTEHDPVYQSAPSVEINRSVLENGSRRNAWVGENCILLQKTGRGLARHRSLALQTRVHS